MKLTPYLEKIVKHSLVYGAGDFLGRAVGLLLIPLYTRVLAQEQFGQLQLLLIFQTFGLMVLPVGQVATLMRYFTLAGSEAEQRKVVGGVTLIVGLANLIVGIPAAIGAPWITGRLLGDAGAAPLLRILEIGVVLRVLATIPMTVLRMEERSHLYAAANFLRLLTALGLILFFVVGLHLGVRGVILGEAGSSAVFFLLLLPTTLRTISSRFDRPALAEYLRYGSPFVVGNLGSFFLLSLDKLFLGGLGLVREAGMYALGGKFGILLNVVIIGPFSLVWGPLVFRIVRENPEPEAKRLFASVLTYYALILYWAALALVTWRWEIFSLAAPASYAPALSVVPLLVLCYVLIGFYQNFEVGLRVSRQTHYTALAFVVAALVSVLGNLILTPRFRMMGAAVSTLAAYLTVASVVAVSARRHYPVSYQGKRLALAAGYAAILGVAGWHAASLPLVPALVAKSAVVLFFPLGLAWSRFLRQAEREEIRAIWRRFRRPRLRPGSPDPIAGPEENPPD